MVAEATVRTNSNQVKASFKKADICVLTMKVVKTDRSDYEPNF